MLVKKKVFSQHSIKEQYRHSVKSASCQGRGFRIDSSLGSRQSLSLTWPPAAPRRWRPAAWGARPARAPHCRCPSTCGRQEGGRACNINGCSSKRRNQGPKGGVPAMRHAQRHALDSLAVAVLEVPVHRLAQAVLPRRLLAPPQLQQLLVADEVPPARREGRQGRGSGQPGAAPGGLPGVAGAARPPTIH